MLAIYVQICFFETMSSRQPSKPKTKKGVKPRSSTKKVGKQVKAPVSMGKQINQTKASFAPVRGGDAAVRIKHTEFLCDIASPSTLGTYIPIRTIAINPGNVDFAPWLSQLAMQYETYTIEKLTVRYESTCATAKDGVVEMLVDYDPYDAFPANKTAFMNSHRATRSNVWMSGKLVCDPADLKKIPKRYCLDVPPEAGRDIRLYNVGNLFIALSGAIINTTFGELYVDYEIVLQTPNMNQPPDFVDITLAGDTAPTTPWRSIAGVTAAVTGAAGLVTAVADNWDKLQFNKVGKYLVENYWKTDAAHAPVDAEATITSVDGRATISSPYSQSTFAHSASPAGLISQTAKVIEVVTAPAVVSFDATPSGSAGFNLTGGGATTSRTHISSL